MINLANDITNNPYWIHTKIFTKEPDPDQLLHPVLSPPSELFVQVLPADVLLQMPHRGWIDSYIDNIIGLCIHKGENTIRITKAILLAIFIFVRPSKSAPPPSHHKYLISIVKMIAEGRQEKRRIVSGWLINTRAFIVQLPMDNFLTYSKYAKEVIHLRKASNDNIESIIGRLEQVAYAVPHPRFFLNRLRHLQLSTKKQTNVNIPMSVILDLKLFVEIIKQASLGTSINLVCR